ncbi:MAG: tRNA epoxyqueuosine(34) reductase QueG [Gemmatimonadaceae bacterium]
MNGSSAVRVKAAAYALGFDLVGITRLGPSETAPAFRAWLDRGYAGTMGYLVRGADKRDDTRHVFDGAVSAIVVAMNYGGTRPSGPIARYARGRDYHDVIVDRLNDLLSRIRETIAPRVNGKPYVDTGPILERELARRAGIGWFGKNTNLINPRLGSFFFIGSLLVDLELDVDAPFEADRCGSCTRCLTACPTAAFPEPRVLDATKCISYLTIELRDAIPEPLREPMGSLVFGCDICQTCCPWNVRFAQELPEDSPFKPREVTGGKDARQLAREVLAMDLEAYRAAFRGSAMRRARLPAMKRNAAVVLGNVGTEDDVEVLSRALDDEEPLVREHAAWALAQLRRRDAAPEPVG